MTAEETWPKSIRYLVGWALAFRWRLLWDPARPAHPVACERDGWEYWFVDEKVPRSSLVLNPP